MHGGSRLFVTPQNHASLVPITGLVIGIRFSLHFTRAPFKESVIVYFEFEVHMARIFRPGPARSVKGLGPAKSVSCPMEKYLNWN